MLTIIIIAFLILYVGIPLLALLLVESLQAWDTVKRDCARVIDILAGSHLHIEYLIPVLMALTPFVLLAYGLLR
jgi:hypothetical protein